MKHKRMDVLDDDVELIMKGHSKYITFGRWSIGFEKYIYPKRYFKWLYHLDERTTNFIAYMRFSHSPFCQYMPFFDFKQKVLYFINKSYWEYPKWNRKKLHYRICHTRVNEIREVRFINNIVVIANINNNNYYYNNYLDYNYINFLQKYNIITSGKLSRRIIRSWSGQSLLSTSNENVSLDYNFHCFDEKLISKKIIKVGVFTFI